MDRSTLVVVALALTLALILAATWIYSPGSPSGTGARSVYTVREFMEEHPWWNGVAGSQYAIEDVVVGSTLLRTPGLHYSDFWNLTIDSNERMAFILVTFASMPLFQLQFMNNRTSDFPAGKTKFNLTVQQWDDLPSGYPMLEHNYVWFLLSDYKGEIKRGNYSTFQTNATLQNTTLSIRILSVDDVYPLPVNWSQLYVAFLSGTRREEGPRRGQLHVGGQIVAELTRPAGSLDGLRNFSVNLPFAVGQEIRVRYDPLVDFYDRIRIETGIDAIGMITLPIP